MADEDKPKVTRSGPRPKDMPTRASNINRGERCDVYVGRGTPFGNPFPVWERDEDGEKVGLDEVIRKYREHFYQKLKMDPKFKSQVDALKGKILGCHCVPLRCHTEVIIEYLDGPKTDSTPR